MTACRVVGTTGCGRLRYRPLQEASLQARVKQFVDEMRPWLDQRINQWQALSLRQVADRAGRGNDVDNKRHDHLCQLSNYALENGYIDIMSRLENIKTVKSYDKIYNITSLILKSTAGLGLMWAYDTAFAFGAHKNCLPTEVYLQRGARAGARNILKRARISELTMPSSAFPSELQQLQPWEIEIFLCINKDYLK